MAALYARYIPPGRTATASKAARAEQEISKPFGEKGSLQLRNDGGNKKKRKRTDKDEEARKVKKLSKRKQQTSLAPTESLQTSEPSTGQPTEPASPEPSNDVHPSRRALFGGTDSPVKDLTKAQEIEPDVSMRKHQGVLTKFRKSTRSSALVERNDRKPQIEEEPTELHDLVALPQPAREQSPEFQATYSTLPPWLQHPVKISSSTTVSFSELGVSHKTVEHLEARGLAKAFAVQSALIPRLMTKMDFVAYRPNDLCVSAPTGSGKTLGYALPIVENLRRRLSSMILRAVVVVPTRELVDQAAATFRLCAAGTTLRLVTCAGNQSFREEQADLVTKLYGYDLKRHVQLSRRIRQRQLFQDVFSADEGDVDDMSSSEKQGQYYRDVLAAPEHHVPHYRSNADILICTPGRLVDHITKTAGFSLADVEYLVIDEADRLLDQSFQDWVRVVKAALDDISGLPSMIAEQRYVKKIVLSATMTRDVAQLNALGLRRPTMIVVGASGADAENSGDSMPLQVDEAGRFELPTGLKEFAVPVGDGAQKPLYLLELIGTLLQARRHRTGNAAFQETQESAGASSASTSSSTDSDNSGSESSVGSSEGEVSEMETSSASSSDESDEVGITRRKSIPESQLSLDLKTPKILVFAASTAEAHRIHHLLNSLISKVVDVTPGLTVITRSKPSGGGEVIKHSKGSHIIISTDRASRGLDLPLTHVINYTIPRSLESYVHRVGRTARAGRPGEAWSLFGDKEGRWFWNEVARSARIARRSGVYRRKVDLTNRWTDRALAPAQDYHRVLAEMTAMVEVEKRRK